MSSVEGQTCTVEEELFGRRYREVLSAGGSRRFCVGWIRERFCGSAFFSDESQVGLLRGRQGMTGRERKWARGRGGLYVLWPSFAPGPG